MNALRNLMDDEGRRRRWRLILLVGGPTLALLIGLGLYVMAGRYVSTEDAYIKADLLPVAAEVSGRAVAVAVHKNEVVQQGQVLFRIDPAPFQLALNQAQAALAVTRNSVEALKAAYREKQAELAQAQEDITYARREYARREGLVARKAVSESTLDAARHTLAAARLRAKTLQRAIDQVQAELGAGVGLPVDRQPQVREAQARVDQAALDLSHTVVHAPMDAVVGAKNLLVGDYVTRGQPVLSLVATHHYIDAHLKETALTHVRVGQSATVTVDTYPGLTWHARVESISPATGAEFSLLPAQNASGNWVKVVQRITVRLALLDHHPGAVLRSGMSTTVSIDTGERRIQRWLGETTHTGGAQTRSGVAGDASTNMGTHVGTTVGTTVGRRGAMVGTESGMESGASS